VRLDHHANEGVKIVIVSEEMDAADGAVEDVIDESAGSNAGVTWHGWNYIKQRDDREN
jgi:hypothetical protein